MASTSGENDKELRLKYMLHEINNNTPTTEIDDYYDFTNDKRGVALLFNHEFKGIEGLEREGSEKDCAGLKIVLENFKFEVQIFEDLRLEQIQKILYDVSKVDHSNNDCLLVAVMTHGKDGGEIFSADQCYHIQELWKNFVGSKCESLVGKPKLFFIQACRGPMNYSGALQTGRKTNEEDAESENDILIPNSDDFMIMYPASKGHKSYRNILQGSWFIQTLCNELIINSQYDLIQILLRVKRKVAVYSRTEKLSLFNRIFKKQMPSIESRLTKLVYFSQSSMNYKTAFKIDPYQQQIIPFKVANIMVD